MVISYLDLPRLEDCQRVHRGAGSVLEAQRSDVEHELPAAQPLSVSIHSTTWASDGIRRVVMGGILAFNQDKLTESINSWSILNRSSASIQRSEWQLAPWNKVTSTPSFLAAVTAGIKSLSPANRMA